MGPCDMENVQFKAGQVILTQGDEGDSAFLIVSGAVEVVVGDGDKAKTIAKLKDGDVFGEMSLLAPGPRSATVRALVDTELTVTSYDDFMGSFRENPDQALEFMKVLVVRLRKMNELMAGLDPKRGLIDVLWDWISAEGVYADEALSDEERERRLAISGMRILF